MSSETPAKFKIEWGEAELVTPELLAAGTFSVNTGSDVPGETAFPAAILFDSARVELNAARPEAQGYGGAQDSLYAVWTGALRVPFKDDPEGRGGVWFKSDLRGFVAKDEGARALLIVDLAGERFVREFPFDQKIDPGDFTHSLVHQSRTTPTAGLAVAIFILAERRDAASGVHLKLDSIDVEINPNFRA